MSTAISKIVKKVLNVGGGASRDVPLIFKGWDQDVLDIDPMVQPDIVCDAKDMRKLRGQTYDAVYCSHNLEHFYRHEVPTVLQGFVHVLKADGFTYIVVPDIKSVLEALVRGNHDITDTAYISPGGPISFHDIIYGWGKQMSKGNLYYAHKTGFTEKTLTTALRSAKFAKVLTATDDLGNLFAFAFKSNPSKAKLRMLGL